MGAAVNAWTPHPIESSRPQPAARGEPQRSPIVARLIQPGVDSGKRRIRQCLVQLPDHQLRAGLGLSDADIAALRVAALPDLAAAAASAVAPRTAHRSAVEPADRLAHAIPVI